MEEGHKKRDHASSSSLESWRSRMYPFSGFNKSYVHTDSICATPVNSLLHLLMVRWVAEMHGQDETIAGLLFSLRVASTMTKTNVSSCPILLTISPGTHKKCDEA